MGLANLVQIADAEFGLAGKSVAELGCLDGHYTKELAAIAASVVALDVRNENLKASEEACQGLRNVTFMLCDVERDPIPRADVIFHSGVLYHLTSPIQHLSQICGIARHGIILDTHFTEHTYSVLVFGGKEYHCLPKGERTEMPRAGIRPVSYWMRLPDIIGIMKDHFTDVRTESIRNERNGLRCTILAKGPRHAS